MMILGPHTVSVFGFFGSYMLWETVRQFGNGFPSLAGHIFGVSVSAVCLGVAALLARSLYQHYHNLKVVTLDEFIAHTRAA